MYLNRYHLAKIAIPFLSIAVILYFQQNIMNYMQDVLPNVKQYSVNNINLQTNLYKKIKRNIPEYEKRRIDLLSNNKQIDWVCQAVLYHPQITHKKETYKTKWRLSAVFPKYNTAIIDSQMVHTGSRIHNAKIIRITHNAVLIKTFKGLKWVSLFQ